jgi:hypothetical protein
LRFKLLKQCLLGRDQTGARVWHAHPANEWREFGRADGSRCAAKFSAS